MNFRAPKRRQIKPAVLRLQRKTTPVRRLTVNRKPLRNPRSLAQPPIPRNELYSPSRHLLEFDIESAKPGLLRRLHGRAYYALLTGLERRIYENQEVSLGAVSQRTATLLANYFQRQDVRIIPNGVDAAQFSLAARLSRRPQPRLRSNLQENDFVLLLIGNDWRVKGLPTVLQAMVLFGIYLSTSSLSAATLRISSGKAQNHLAYSSAASLKRPARGFSISTQRRISTSVQAAKTLSACPSRRPWPAACR